MAYKGYTPQNGIIPDDVLKIESVGEACHDFNAASSGIRVNSLRKELFNILRLPVNNEHKTSELIHERFNGGGLLKADLRLGEPSLVYTNGPGSVQNIDMLRQRLFPDDTNVNPLIFTIPFEYLPRFEGILNEVQRRISLKYGILPGASTKLQVTHDAYQREGMAGNPFNAEIIYSAATICDPGKAGSGDDILNKAMTDRSFILNTDLVKGNSFWGQWAIETNLHGDSYPSATIHIKLNTLFDQSPGDYITITMIKGMTSGPSINILSIMLDGVISGKNNEQILNTLSEKTNSGKPLILPKFRSFYLSCINQIIRLYRINPFYGLMFILILKEMGDMSQHMVAVKYKHLAGGSVDGLSAVAFLKRGVPISYLFTVDKPTKIKRLQFRVAGTLHVKGGMSDAEFEAQRLSVAAAASVYAKKAKADKMAKTKAENRELAIRDAQYKAILAASIKDAQKRGRFERAGRFKGGYHRKQIGGNRYALDLIIQIINRLFAYLYLILSLREKPENCTLFNMIDIPDEDLLDSYIDLTLIVKDGREIFFVDNHLLGLPIARLIYIYYHKLEEVLEYQPDGFTDTETRILIEDFLRDSNFNESEIEVILNIDITKIKPHEKTELFDDIIRQMSESDKEYFEHLVYNYGAVIAGVSIVEPSDNINRGYETNTVVSKKRSIKAAKTKKRSNNKIEDRALKRIKTLHNRRIELKRGIVASRSNNRGYQRQVTFKHPSSAQA